MMISSNLTNLSKELVLNSKRKLIRVLINLRIMQKVDIDFLSKRDSTILNLSEKFIIKPIMLIMYKRSSTKLSPGRRIFIRGLKPFRNLNLNKIGLWPLNSLISYLLMANFLKFQLTKQQIDLIKSFSGNFKIFPKKFLVRKKLQTHFSSSRNPYRMTMVSMKGKHAMERSMEMVNITSKTGISMKGKCTKELCREKASILGLIKTFTKELFLKIR